MELTGQGSHRPKGVLQKRLLGHTSVQQFQGWLQHRKEQHGNEFKTDVMLGGISCAQKGLLGQLRKSSPSVKNMGTNIYSRHRRARLGQWLRAVRTQLTQLPQGCYLLLVHLLSRLSVTPGVSIIFAAHSPKELSDITDWYLEECLCQYFLSPLLYQVLRVKHMLKYFTGSRPILTHRNQREITRNGQEPGEHKKCHQMG